MTYRVIAITPERYKVLETLPAETSELAALRELLAWSPRRICAVILRDPSGKRISVRSAMDALEVPSSYRSRLDAWLRMTEAA